MSLSIISSSKLTKMWSNVKKQKEDNFHYGGERKGRQVIANSFIPTILCVLILLLRWNLIQIPNFSLEFIQSRCAFLFWLNRPIIPSNCSIILYWMLCRYLGKWSGYHLINSLSSFSSLEACSSWYKWWY